MNAKHPRTQEYLRHMLDAIGPIEAYTTGFDLNAFNADTRTQDAVIRNFEVIGEAARSVLRHDSAFVTAHPEVPRGKAYQMRNALNHGYAHMDMDMETIWRTVQTSLPQLKNQLTVLLTTPPGYGSWR
jgi:uncharacterized protein with HEPN domain